MFRRLLFIGYDFGKHMGRKNISAYAASTAFFIFLSLIPALMLLCSLLPYTPITEANLMTVAKDISPDAVNPLLVNVITEVYGRDRLCHGDSDFVVCRKRDTGPYAWAERHP